MELIIAPEAQQWFMDELQLETGDGVRFYGKYGGSTNVHTGFSVGIEVAQPEKSLVVVESNGIKFFAEESDEWFFNGYDLEVTFDEELKEPRFLFSVKQ